MTAQGHPRTIYNRAIESGNLLVAEMTLREVGKPSLVELLELTALIAQKDPRRHPRVAVRWLQKLLERDPDLTIDDVALATASLQALGGRHHAAAMASLREMAEEATAPRRERRH